MGPIGFPTKRNGLAHRVSDVGVLPQSFARDPVKSALFFLACLPSLTLSAATVSYNREVRPVLSDNCFACHGPDSGNRKAGLRLDQPGTWDRAEFMHRIEATDPEEIMPPPKAHKVLSASQKEILRRWIREGAAYESHWSFVPPVPPSSGRGIDDFVRAEWPKHGLAPSPRAEPAALVRRLALDLTGLPPTLEEQARFAAPDAYEAMVDHFLAKAAFGEHMAVAWLDAARYADTNGYQVDRDRELWPWRDWVVRAFNANMPFDRFTIEQLAGDLLPGATLDQRIATGFHRNHMLNEEGGIIAEEFLAEYTADRVETTAAVWLGQTFNCCRCHDHKYDPFTQRDFYAMKAFFHNVPERGVGLYGNPIRTNAPPFVKLPSPELEQKITALTAKLQGIEERKKGFASQDLEPWAQSLAQDRIEWLELAPTQATGGDQPPVITGTTVRIGPQETRQNNITITLRLPATEITGIRLECTTADASASFQWSELQVAKAKLRSLDPAYVNLLDNDRRTRSPLSLRPDNPAQALFEVAPGLTGPETQLTLAVENAGGTSQWRVSVCSAPRDSLAPARILAIAKTPPDARSAPDRKLLSEYRLSQLPDYRQLLDEEAALRKEIAAREGEIPTTLVMEEQREARPTFVLMRGAYDKPGAQVTPATPAALPKLAADLPGNRLGLARWLVSRENPLTARVTVNRFWQQIFGTGLVRSSEDFGSQGDLPSHPELLDWLAVTFQETGWDVKRLIKLMVMSETYRQSSRHAADPAVRELDPGNVWLARAPRHRLPAEVIRDQALASSGLLVGKMGGPAVKPYHPPGLYEQVVAQKDNPKATYQQGTGEDLHRRSLYTYWKRSVPHPGLLLFDAPFREVCALRRTRSNTPLQALNLMNDPTYVESARFLAQRMILEGGATPQSRLAHGFQLLLARAPSAQESTILLAALERTLADFRRETGDAAQFLAVGEAKPTGAIPPAEWAAYATVASTLLNLDETITRE
ncbi:MAG: Protein of unknown function DUF1553/DUF1549/Planctomycete cytochrome C [Verrucomicrobia bacterium]|nr:MAG: Protein of unknown function DUF1553/DUF1549/Planctomycete cytochrome C [Verrucomicrobiota bacterium]